MIIAFGFILLLGLLRNFSHMQSVREPHIFLVRTDTREHNHESYAFKTMALWVLWATRFGYTTIHVDANEICSTVDKSQTCTGYNEVRVHPAWMKIIVTRAVLEIAAPGDFVMFVDPDVRLIEPAIGKSFFELLEDFIASGKPGLAVMDNILFWASIVNVSNTYEQAINSGIMVYRNVAQSKLILNDIWNSMLEQSPFEKVSDIVKDAKIQWPWEQERVTWYYNEHPELFFLTGGGNKGFDRYAGKQIGFEDAVGRISGFIFHDVDFKKECGDQAKIIFIDHFDCPQFLHQPKSQVSNVVSTGRLGPSYQLEVHFSGIEEYECGFNDTTSRYLEYANRMWSNVGLARLRIAK